jgi:hypothetical protein
MMTRKQTSTELPIPSQKGRAKAQGPFQLLRPGSIEPRGWIRDWMKTIADGWTLHYAKKREPWLHSVLWKRFKKPFPIPVEDQEAPDYCAYFTDGFLRLSYIVPESRLRKEFEPWLEKVIASQDADGYLGALDPPGRWNNWLEVFHQAVLIEALIYNYEMTGKRSYLDVAMRAARQPLEHWDSHTEAQRASLYGAHGSCMIRPMLQIYSLSGDKEYLDFAVTILEKQGRTQHYLRGGGCAGQHNVCECERIGFPAIVYEYTGKPELLKASMMAWDKMQPLICVDGQPHGNEDMFPRRPRGNAEHCGSVEWAITNEHFLRITGEVKFADAVERCLFNAYPAAKSYDAMTLCYMHSPNQLYATDWSGPHYNDPDYAESRQYYSTAHSPLCCNVISHRAMPYFSDQMVMAAKGGLAVVFYGPCRAAASVDGAGTVEIVQDTTYPFEDNVKITVNPEKEAAFDLQLRIPGWCSKASLELNGKKLNVKAKPGTFAVISRKWRCGDTITLAMEVPIRLEKYPAHAVRVGGAAVIRGPLTYTMRVPEEWKKFKSILNAPISDVVSYRLMPKKGAAWNYGLVLDEKKLDKCFKMKTLKRPRGGYPFQHPPVGLEVRARRVLNWKQEGNDEHPMTPGQPFAPMKLAKRVETITLVPYAFTKLRMTYLPLCDE